MSAENTNGKHRIAIVVVIIFGGLLFLLGGRELLVVLAASPLVEPINVLYSDANGTIEKNTSLRYYQTRTLGLGYQYGTVPDLNYLLDVNGNVKFRGDVNILGTITNFTISGYVTDAVFNAAFPVTDANILNATRFLQDSSCDNNVNCTITGTINTSIDANVDANIAFGGVEFKFPTTDGSANQVLHTDGIGNLSWNTDDTGGAGSGGFYFAGGNLILGDDNSFHVNDANLALTYYTQTDANGNFVLSSTFNSAFDADFNINNSTRLLQDSNCDNNANCTITGTFSGLVSAFNITSDGNATFGAGTYIFPDDLNILSALWSNTIGSLDNNNLSIQTNNATRVTILSDGNVGINDTTPTSNFFIDGDANITGGIAFGGVEYIFPVADGSNNQVLHTDGAGNLSWNTDDTGAGSSVWTQTGNDINYSIGNVGIDINTPVEKLHVGGTTRIIGDLNVGDTGAASNWSFIGGDGTGWADSEFEFVYSVSDHDGNVVAGLGNSTNDAEVWTYDGTTWTLIGGDGVASSWNNDYERLLGLQSHDGNLFAALGGQSGDAEVWTYNGTIWSKFGGDGLNSSWPAGQFEVATDLLSYDGNLYVALGWTHSNDAEVWVHNGTSWSRAGGDGDNNSWNTNYQAVYTIEEFGGMIYAGIGNDTGEAEVWDYNGDTWTQIGGDGINSSWNTNYESVRDLKTSKGALYAGLGNGTNDAEVWSYDGATWTKVGGDGLNSSWNTDYEFTYSLGSDGVNTFASLASGNGDAEIWAYNGATWSLLGGDGTGWADSTYEYIPEIHYFDGKTYAGISGTTAGEAELWQYDANLVTGTVSDVLITGDISIDTPTLVTTGDQVGIGVATPTTKLTVDGNITPAVTQTYGLGSPELEWKDIFLENAATVSSSIEDKEKIKDLPSVMLFINGLRPVSYKLADQNITKLIFEPARYNPQGQLIKEEYMREEIITIKKTQRHFGFLAEDVEANLNAHDYNANKFGLFFDDGKGNLGLRYSQFIPINTKGIQENNTRVQELKTENQMLKDELCQRDNTFTWCS